jgi:hypothetical protein
LFGKYSSPDKANKHEMKENFRSRFTVVAFPTHFLSLSGLGYIVLSQLLFRASNFIVFPQLHREKNLVIVPVLLFLYYDLLFNKVSELLLLFYLAIPGIYRYL